VKIGIALQDFPTSIPCHGHQAEREEGQESSESFFQNIPTKEENSLT
jgi:hypothetical protein